MIVPVSANILHVSAAGNLVIMYLSVQVLLSVYCGALFLLVVVYLLLILLVSLHYQCAIPIS